MKRSLSLCIFILLLAVSVNAGAKEFVIKLATVAPDGSLWMEEMKKMDSRIQSMTNGEVRFEFYAGGTQGDDKQMVEKIKNKQLVGAALTGVGLGDIFPSYRVIELPFTYRSYDEFDYVLRRLSNWFKKNFEEKGFKVLGWSDQGFVYLMSQKEIRTVADVRNAKPWVWDVDPLALAGMEAFGINPVPLSLENVATSLDTGKIDTIYMSPVALIAFQWYRKTKYLIDCPLTNGSGALIMDKAYFDAMPAEYQTILLTVVQESVKTLRKKTRDENEKALKALAKKGVIFLKPTEAELAEFYAVGAKGADAQVGKLYPKKLLEKVRTLLTEYRTKKGK